MEELTHQFVEFEVTKQKFLQELRKFKSVQHDYRRIGILLLEEEYPNLYFSFAAPALSPIPIIFAVKINFDNYDIEPLSVKFVHPLTFQPKKRSELTINLLRRFENGVQPQDLLVADLDDQPFLCIPGVREYHNHTYHTGDSWFLHRGVGNQGSLCFILDNLQLYGTSSIKSFHVNIQVASPKIAAILDLNNLPT